MASPKDTSVSKLLSLVLRHEPGTIGITLDESGWTHVPALLDALSLHGKPIDRAELARIVRESDKQRFAFSEDGSKIRANQGHSVQVELGYEARQPPELLFHGTVARFLDPIQREGLRKGERHHVHLSATRDLAATVGKRRGAPVILEVTCGVMAREGFVFFVSTNGVWLTDHVPPRFLRQLDES